MNVIEKATGLHGNSSGNGIGRVEEGNEVGLFGT